LLVFSGTASRTIIAIYATMMRTLGALIRRQA